jgi:DNA repair photolyase
LYENVLDYERAARRWLRKPNRRNLGLGIDCSDSLLYEGVTGHARRLIPLFASAESNPHGCRLVLLTKSKNVHYLEGLPAANVLVTFSLNPEAIADLWEGKFCDGVRVTPLVEERLAASLRVRELGFEVRWRVDPILPVEGWQDVYAEFFRAAARAGHVPSRVTLGTYRETQPSLAKFVGGWGLPPLEWKPPSLVKDGMHYHISEGERVNIYQFLAGSIRDAWRGRGRVPVVALCKEPRTVRHAVGLEHDRCNCGP